MRLLSKSPSTKKFERQFTPTCNVWVGKGCHHRATWAAWSVHGIGHQEWFCFCCDGCRAIAEKRWEEYRGGTCSCGYEVTGTIDRHLRFIRL